MSPEERTERRLTLEQAMAAMTGEEPITIGEDGEVIEGAPGDLDREEDESEPYVFDPTRFCPLYVEASGRLVSGQEAEAYDVGREMWGVCKEHQVCWLIGLTGGWSSPSTWKQHETKLQRYRRVEPLAMLTLRGELLQQGAELHEERESYDRLWRLLRDHAYREEELLWLLDAHHDLPSDILWLIRKQLQRIKRART